ncbi:hypothetical protein [Actinoplanes awajinensis]|uniref:Uncharacterized protein n=1 Tax=Actinoplanes awajinensis subsp. mycoplanecinus TaxID=135947 RepID=A0A124G7L8_9ACTN|nr:hypothetical protein [Actinoplanes awajinensis]KUL23067.1 hypothetical protein ADL15_46850 [Actinoplanes awajinensis subsp. mycoplanecinus]
MRRPALYLAGLFLATGASLALAAPAQAADTHCKKNHGASVYRAHVHGVGYARDWDDDDYGVVGVVGVPVVGVGYSTGYYGGGYGYHGYGYGGGLSIGVGVGIGVGF